MQKIKVRVLTILFFTFSIFHIAYSMVKQGKANEEEEIAFSTDEELPINYLENLYQELLQQDSLLPREAFTNAIIGYFNLSKNAVLTTENTILSIADMSQSANNKRLWIIDLKAKEILLNTYVAHGKNSGEEFALSHSNQINSLQSSAGFYRTANTYMGKHGYSLRLEGLDTLFNDRAMQRAIVLHGADYVNENFINNHKRLGRSFGCPAVPQADNDFIIETIKEGTCLYLHFDDERYLSQSKWLQGNKESTWKYLAELQNSQNNTDFKVQKEIDSSF